MMIGVFLDFKKAFDCDLWNKMHDWCTSYLSNRKQFVQIDDPKIKYLKYTTMINSGSFIIYCVYQ